MAFEYSAEWHRDGFAISCSLPLVDGRQTTADDAAHRFFANLLPEGEARERVVRTLRIPNTDFDLLRALGGECAGALALSTSEASVAHAVGRYRALPEGEVADLAARRGYVHPDRSGARPRLSLAGAQHKCPVLVRGGAYFLPVNDAPSTHILKFEVADFRNVPAYETFTTALAKAVGLEVVDVELRTAGGRHYVEITRFDRVVKSDGRVSRLHQEDFCQALGFGYERKYEADGGPSLSDCVRLLRDTVVDPVIDIERLMVWQAFNWLAGNADGHAKNLALLHSGRTIRLAPFYDLVCTRAIPRVDRRLAMGVGGETDPGKISASHWQALAVECGIRPRFLQPLVQALAGRILQSLQPVRSEFERRYGPWPALQRIESVVVRQCRRANAGLKG